MAFEQFMARLMASHIDGTARAITNWRAFRWPPSEFAAYVGWFLDPSTVPRRIARGDFAEFSKVPKITLPD